MLEKKISNRIVFYVLFEKKGVVREYVRYYLQGLQQIANRVIVLHHGQLSEAGREKLNTMSVEITQNITFDDLNHDEVILTNDFCYGPIYPFEAMFEAMRTVSCDFWSITKTETGSNFLVLRASLLQTKDWKRYWKKIQKTPQKWHALSTISYFMRRHYCYASYCHHSPDYTDMAIEAPDQLVIEQKCPVIEKNAFCAEYNRFLSCGRGGASKKVFQYLQQQQFYDTNYILDDLLATTHYEYIKNILHLNYFLPADEVTPSLSLPHRRPKTALFFHVYYKDLLPTSFRYMQAMPDDADIYITTSQSDLLPLIKQYCEDYGLKNTIIQTVLARGRSESAFLVTAQAVIYQYDYVCVVHDKRSSFLKPGCVGLEFGYHNLDAVLKTKQYVQNIINLLEGNPRLGLLVPIVLLFSYFQEFYGAEWGQFNFSQLAMLLKKFKIDVPIDASVPPLMPMGGMFWCRPASLKKLIDKPWIYGDFPKEPLPLDGSLLHVIERAYPFFAQDACFLTGWISSVEDAAVHLTNITYLHRQSKMTERRLKRQIQTRVRYIFVRLVLKVKKILISS